MMHKVEIFLIKPDRDSKKLFAAALDFFDVQFEDMGKNIYHGYDNELKIILRVTPDKIQFLNAETEFGDEAMSKIIGFTNTNFATEEIVLTGNLPEPHSLQNQSNLTKVEISHGNTATNREHHNNYYIQTAR